MRSYMTGSKWKKEEILGLLEYKYWILGERFPKNWEVDDDPDLPPARTITDVIRLSDAKRIILKRIKEAQQSAV